MKRGHTDVILHKLLKLGTPQILVITNSRKIADMESTWHNSTEQNFQPGVLLTCALKPWCSLDTALPWGATGPGLGASPW